MQKKDTHLKLFHSEWYCQLITPNRRRSHKLRSALSYPHKKLHRAHKSPSKTFPISLTEQRKREKSSLISTNHHPELSKEDFLHGKTRSTTRSNKWSTCKRNSSKCCPPLMQEESPPERINVRSSETTSKRLRKSARNKPSRERPQLTSWKTRLTTRSNMPINNTSKFWSKRSTLPSTPPKRKRTFNTPVDYTLVLPAKLLKVTHQAFHTTKFLSQLTEAISMSNWDRLRCNTVPSSSNNKTSSNRTNEQARKLSDWWCHTYNSEQ